MIDPARVARDLFGWTRSRPPCPASRTSTSACESGATRYVLKVHGSAPGPRARGRGARAPARRAGGAAARRAGTRNENGRTVRLLSWLDGRPWADARRRPGQPRPRRSRGWTARCADFEHPAMHRPHRWELRHAATSGSTSPRSTTSPTRSSTTTPTSTTCSSAEDGTVDRADRLRRRRLDRARVRARGRGRVRDAGPARPGARGRAARPRLPRGRRRCARTSSRSLFELMRRAAAS